MKFLISVFLIFPVYGLTKSLNQGAVLSYGELRNEKIFVKNPIKHSGFSDFITVDGKLLIKKKEMSKKEFQQWLQQDKTIFFSLFEPSSSPYAGPISNQIECAKRLEPKPLFTTKKKENLVIQGFFYKSNSRFVALSCQNEEDSTYDSVYIAIYCTNFGYKITVHKKNRSKVINKKKLMKIVMGFSCLS